MDELEIKGKKYISSKRASELTGYAKDYIGQMVRGGKIGAVRVGRAWYVDSEALLAKEEALQTEVEEVAALAPTKIQEQRKHRALSPASLKALGYIPSPLPDTWSTVQYFEDNRGFLPALRLSDIYQEKFSKPATENKDFQDYSKNEVRIRVLTNALSPAIEKTSPKNIAISAKKVRSKRWKGLSQNTLAFGALSAALLVFFFFSAGFFISSDLVLRDGSQASASVLVGLEYVRDTLMKFPPFQIGVSALQGFFTVIFSSFYGFFYTGINFILKLLSLV